MKLFTSIIFYYIFSTLSINAQTGQRPPEFTKQKILRIEGENFQFDPFKSLLELLINRKKDIKEFPAEAKKETVTLGTLQIRDCTFDSIRKPMIIDSSLLKLYEFNIKHLYLFKNIFNKDVQISNVYGKAGEKTDIIDLQSNKLRNLSLNDCRTFFCTIWDLTFHQRVDIYSCDFDDFSFWGGNSKTDSLNLNISHSKFGTFSFDSDSKNTIGTKSIDFFLDSFLYYVSIEKFAKKEKYNDKKLSIIRFSGCYINGYVNLNLETTKSNVQFSNCEFGPDAILDLTADSVTFSNCRKIPHPINLYLRPANKNVTLTFIYTDVKNINFDYNKHLKLNTIGKNYLGYYDAWSGLYETLLEKYKHQGKAESLQNVDVEFKQFKYNNSIGGKFLNIVDNVWWYYGYRKYYVLLWTFGFIIFFFVINYSTWNIMKLTYPIISEKDISFHERQAHSWKIKIRKFINVFIFTSFIFFSLKIDFSKISYKSVLGLLSFFSQYIIGLICLFFIVNWILKAG